MTNEFGEIAFTPSVRSVQPEQGSRDLWSTPIDGPGRSWVTTEVVGEVRGELLASLAVPGYKARVERGLLVHVAAFDWNCPQHITPHYTNEEIVPLVRPVRNRIDALEQELARYRQARQAEKES